MSGWDKNKSDYSGGVWPMWKYIGIVAPIWGLFIALMVLGSR